MPVVNKNDLYTGGMMAAVDKYYLSGSSNMTDGEWQTYASYGQIIRFGESFTRYLLARKLGYEGDNTNGRVVYI